MWLKSNNLVGVSDINSLDELLQFFQRVKYLKHAHRNQHNNPRGWNIFRTALQGKVMASLFYQPSTRTRFSFESAMIQLGGSVIGTENAKEFSSAVKGESLPDSIIIVSQYAQVIVLRHPDVGSAQQAAAVSSVPVVNAGDGTGEHPTQALLDLYTIWEHASLHHKHTLTLTVVGDLLRGRTVHSLIKLIQRFHKDPGFLRDCKIICVSPKALRLPAEITDVSSVPMIESENLTSDIMRKSDVIYMTRTQNEHGTITGDTLVLTPALATELQHTAQILHPLPRNEELPGELDTLPQAQYFAQAQNGLYVRMQLLCDMLGS